MSDDALEQYKRRVYGAAMQMYGAHRTHMALPDVHAELRKLDIDPEKYAPKPVGFTISVTGQIPANYTRHLPRRRIGSDGNNRTVEEYILDSVLSRLSALGLQVSSRDSDNARIVTDGSLPTNKESEGEWVEEEEDEEDDETG